MLANANGAQNGKLERTNFHRATVAPSRSALHRNGTPEWEEAEEDNNDV